MKVGENMLRSIYRKIVPLKVRLHIGKVRDRRRKNKMLWNLLQDLSDSRLQSDTEDRIHWMKKNSLNVFPYDFIKEYREEDIKVFYDEIRRLYYVLWKGKKLYWKRGVHPQVIARSVNSLYIEQDKDSPHYYLQYGWEPRINSVVADIGAAEGNFSLDIIEQVRKLYLFECNPEWVEALEATFAPWRDKVEIVTQYIGNGNGCVALDAYFSEREIDFIKADIEGAEIAMLLGGTKTFREKISQAIICTYHRFDDENNVKKCLELYGFKCEFSKGYMCFYHADDFARSYFRRGLLYGKKPSVDLNDRNDECGES